MMAYGVRSLKRSKEQGQQPKGRGLECKKKNKLRVDGGHMTYLGNSER